MDAGATTPTRPGDIICMCEADDAPIRAGAIVLPMGGNGTRANLNLVRPKAQAVVRASRPTIPEALAIERAAQELELAIADVFGLIFRR